LKHFNEVKQSTEFIQEFSNLQGKELSDNIPLARKRS